MTAQAVTPAIVTPADVDEWADRITEHAADLWDVDPDTGRVDWDDWTLRFERMHGVDLPGSYDDPAMRKIQRIARQAIREVRA